MNPTLLDVINVSSGSLAGLTNETNYAVLEEIHQDWIEFEKENNSKNWIISWILFWQFKQDEDLVSFERDGFRLEMKESNVSRNRVYCEYKFWDLKTLDEPLFSGNDYGIPMQECWDSFKSVLSLLFFFALENGDVEDDYFENYTQSQLDWLQTPRFEEFKDMVEYLVENA